MKLFSTIKSKIMMLGSAIVLITVTFLGLYFHYLMDKESKRGLEEFENRAMTERKQELKNIINLANSILEAAHKNANDQEQLKKLAAIKLTSIMDVAFAGIESGYRQAVAKNLSKREMEQVKRDMKDFIQKLRFGPKKQNYIWIQSFDPNKVDRPRMVLHPIVPRLNGKGIHNYRYSSGEKKGKIVYATGKSSDVPFFVEMNRVVSKTGEGYVSYDWPTKEADGVIRYRPKISHVRLFRKWGWVLGTGTHFSKLESQIKESAIENIKSFRYGPDGLDYLWIHSYTPGDPDNVSMVMHPTSPALDGKDISQIRYRSGEKQGEIMYATDTDERVPFFVRLNQVIAKSKDGGGFTEYEWPKPTKSGEEPLTAKLSYGKLFAPWNMVVGSGIYLDDIQKVKEEKVLHMKENNWRMITGILVISIVVTVVALLVIYFITRLIFARMNLMVNMFRDIAEGEGDLTRRVPQHGDDEVTELGKWFNTFLDKLQPIIRKVIENANSLMSAADHMNSTARELSESSGGIRSETTEIVNTSHIVTENMNNVAISTQEISDNIQVIGQSVHELNENISTVAAANEESTSAMSNINRNFEKVAKDIDAVASAVEEMSVTLSQINDNTKKAMDVALNVDEHAQNTLATMNDLTQSANETGQVIQLVATIASQTNMLALNATIEAASAGETGKGFAVVAQEVKELANQTAKANQEIDGKIKNIQNEVTKALTYSEDVSRNMSELTDINKATSTALEEQSKASTEISESIDSISDATKFAASNVEETTMGLKEIAKSTAIASQKSMDSAKSANQATEGVKKVAGVSSDVAAEVEIVNSGLQKIQQSVDQIDQEISDTEKSASELAEIASDLNELVGSFKVD